MDLEASRIANAEVENKEILELRENVRTGQEETARLTGKGGPHFYSTASFDL